MNTVIFQRLCAEVINDYGQTGNYTECEIIRQCYEAFESLDSYKDHWHLKPWIVGLMLLKLGGILAEKNKKPGQRANAGQARPQLSTMIKGPDLL